MDHLVFEDLCGLGLGRKWGLLIGQDAGRNLALLELARHAEAHHGHELPEVPRDQTAARGGVVCLEQLAGVVPAFRVACSSLPTAARAARRLLGNLAERHPERQKSVHKTEAELNKLEIA